MLAELYSGDVADGIRVLYGGSVKSGNVAAIMAKPDVDGALVGGARLDPDEFAAICRFRDHLQTVLIPASDLAGLTARRRTRTGYRLTGCPPTPPEGLLVEAVQIVLQVLLVITSLLLTLLILLHKGKGGGLSDMFGGGMSSSLGGSSASPSATSTASPSSSRWCGSPSIVGLGLLARFA